MVDTELSLMEQIQEDYRTHMRQANFPGFRAIAVYRFGRWRQTLTFLPFRWPLGKLYRFLSRWVRNYYGIEIPLEAEIGRRVLIGHQHGIVIHPHAVIEDDCIIRQGVTLGQPSHSTIAAPHLCKGVQVGAGAVIVGAVTIGEGATVGANSVVTMNVPPGGTVFGNPARVIGGNSEKRTTAQSSTQ